MGRMTDPNVCSTSKLSDVAALNECVAHAIEDAGGWLAFDAFMQMALYHPQLGYYCNERLKIGHLPSGGSDFVTAPELSSAFGSCVAAQIGQWWQDLSTRRLTEFGAGSGALMKQVLDVLSARQPISADSISILEVSGHLADRQRESLASYEPQVRWLSALPDSMTGVVLGNEVLDAMPVKLLARINGQWHERGVAMHKGALAFADIPTDLRPPVEINGGHDYVTEVHLQAQAFVATVSERLLAHPVGGAMLFIDYGFSEMEYYHPQRHMGTLMCHHAHTSDTNPLVLLGQKDITAHVNFTAIALAAQTAGMDTVGFTTQSRFLMNCGILNRMEVESVAQRTLSQKLITEHEMGSFFKVLALCTPQHSERLRASVGFMHGDLTHRL